MTIAKDANGNDVVNVQANLIAHAVVGAVTSSRDIFSHPATGSGGKGADGVEANGEFMDYSVERWQNS